MAPMDLLESAKRMLSEVEQVTEYASKQNSDFGSRYFLHEVRHEITRLETISRKKDDTQKEDTEPITIADDDDSINTYSSNLPFLQSVWDATKRCNSIIKLKRSTLLVDVVADSGREWVKVCTATEKKLWIEMAAKGWNWADQSDTEEDEDEDEDDKRQSTDEDDEISILKIARKLLNMADDPSVRVHYTSPRITLVLPRLSRGTPDIDKLLDQIETLSPTISLVTQTDIVNTPPMSSDLLKTMIYDQFAEITPTVNLDCTILLALASDISHSAKALNLDEKTGFSVAIKRQVALEDTTRLLPTKILPALRNRKLVCVEQAAKRMQEIIDEIGTPEEQARAAIFLGKNRDEGESRERLRKLSGLEIPDDLHIPIEVVKDGAVSDPELPVSMAQKVASDLSPLNQAVFLYGWAQGTTTLTSNRTVMKSIEKSIIENGGNQGPAIWLSQPARSLLAKERSRT